MYFPEELRYTKDHIWIKTEGETVTIGITFFAQLELGEIAFVQVKPAGKRIRQGKVFGTIEALKTVSDIFLPVAGTIKESNPLLINDPGIINKDNYGKGWIIKLAPDNADDVNSLLTASEYEKLVNG